MNNVNTEERFLKIRDFQVEQVDKLTSYLGDMLKMDGGAQSAVVKRVRSAWGKCREFEPLFLVRDMALRLKGSIYAVC